jgi:glycosyltransferase involved in cell wall biosynthesis
MNELAKNIAKFCIGTASITWKPYSRLVLISDGIDWSLDHDLREIRDIAQKLNIRTAPSFWRFSSSPQAQLYFSHYSLAENTSWLHSKHNIGITFPEGVPPDEVKHQHPVFQALCKHHERVQRVQVSHQLMKDYILESGIEPAKVFVIPIGVNLSLFRFKDTEMRTQLRAHLGIPENAFVVGSFQKDGVGWDEGMEPKFVKGPDIFVKTIEKLKSSIPELVVLLIGPARGYVRANLDQLGVRYVWLGKQAYPQICRYYSALDLYLVCSRQEGGPKAILESMASGVPLVTTRVGQAIDLVIHGKNGWMVDVEDINGLAYWANNVYQNQGLTRDSVLPNGRATAEANNYAAQVPLWQNFMKGFVEWKD